ncbi:MAG TPA: response regulator transcription factor [Solirubrobacterales bacterium]|nr:response regulator transcription factor [Solirubrobacterales bacterium]
MPVKVALAEDSYIVREGVEQVLRGDEEIEVTASCGDMASLLEAVAADPPDVVLTDIRMPPDGADAGIQIASRLRESHPEIGVVVLSQYAEPGFVLRLLGDGSDGRAYLLKERVADRAELTRAIKAVADGGSVIDPKIVEVLVAAQARSENSPLGEMTPRELDVLAGVAAGKSNAAIAADLVLTKRAVEKHINAIFLKLDLTYSPDADQVSKRVKAALIFLAEAEYQR